jgi:DNA-binding CsgD family transcriptional regulator
MCPSTKSLVMVAAVLPARPPLALIRAMLRAALIYGLALAVLAFLLEWLDYRHFVHGIGTKLYIVALAILFTTLGGWAGARLTRRIPREPFRRNEQALRYLGISGRECEVLELLADGHSNKEIARLLGISPNTVKSHVASVLAKLAATRRTQAISKARALHIVS